MERAATDAYLWVRHTALLSRETIPLGRYCSTTISASDVLTWWLLLQAPPQRLNNHAARVIGMDPQPRDVRTLSTCRATVGKERLVALPEPEAIPDRHA